MMGEINICLLTDTYKQSHAKQYPPGTTKVYSYFESRGGQFDYAVFFGLQYILKKYLVGQVVTQEKIDEAEKFVNAHFGAKVFNREGWEYILNKYQGRLPIKIMAVEEGTVVNNHNVLITVENTDSNCFWLTNFIETLLVQVWYPCTVATISREIKKVIKKYLIETGCSLDDLDFRLHDFGFRGTETVESAGIGGLAHLVNFKGTDTIQALVFAERYYSCSMAGFSIPASEHSTMSSWGRKNEIDAYRNMLEIYPKGTFACVSDTYNIFKAVEEMWGGELKNIVLSRDGRLVIRPDSGDPTIVPIQVIAIALQCFGATLTPKGYELLNDKVRIIQGDGMNLQKIINLFEGMMKDGQAAGNIFFGMGGGLLQSSTRDTLKFAFKCSQVVVNGKERDVWKEPVTDPGKNSKRGKLMLIETNLIIDGQKQYKTIQLNPTYPTENQLKEVFRNGDLYVDYTLDEIRERAKV